MARAASGGGAAGDDRRSVGLDLDQVIGLVLALGAPDDGGRRRVGHGVAAHDGLARQACIADGAEEDGVAGLLGQRGDLRGVIDARCIGVDGGSVRLLGGLHATASSAVASIAIVRIESCPFLISIFLFPWRPRATNGDIYLYRRQRGADSFLPKRIITLTMNPAQATRNAPISIGE